MALTPVRCESISEQVFDQIRRQIIDKQWVSGTKLPSEAELGDIFGVSRVTIRQAIQKLSAMGLVETRLGEGSFVKDADISAQVKAVLMPSAYLNDHSIEEVLNFRIIMEPETAGFAAINATEEDIQKLRGILGRQMDEKHRSYESFAGDDVEFHMTIAKSTGNSLVVANYEILNDIFSSAMQHTVHSLGMDIGISYHKKLLEAIEKRDEKLAIITMKEHMLTTRDQFLNVLKAEGLLSS